MRFEYLYGNQCPMKGEELGGTGNYTMNIMAHLQWLLSFSRFHFSGFFISGFSDFGPTCVKRERPKDRDFIK